MSFYNEEDKEAMNRVKAGDSVFITRHNWGKRSFNKVEVLRVTKTQVIVKTQFGEAKYSLLTGDPVPAGRNYNGEVMLPVTEERMKLYKHALLEKEAKYLVGVLESVVSRGNPSDEECQKIIDALTPILEGRDDN